MTSTHDCSPHQHVPTSVYLPMKLENPFLIAAQFHARALKAALQWQSEAAGFLKHRCECDMQFIDDLMETPEPVATLSTSSNFLQEALNDYSCEAVKAVNFGSTAVMEAIDLIRHEAESFSGNGVATAA